MEGHPLKGTAGGRGAQLVLSAAGRGGGAAAGKYVAVAGYSADGTRFLVRDFDADGQPTGDPYEVYAYSLPRIGGLAGAQPLTNCLPNIIAGDELWIERRRLYRLGAWVSDWFAEGVYMKACT